MELRALRDTMSLSNAGGGAGGAEAGGTGAWDDVVRADAYVREREEKMKAREREKAEEEACVFLERYSYSPAPRGAQRRAAPSRHDP